MEPSSGPIFAGRGQTEEDLVVTSQVERHRRIAPPFDALGVPFEWWR